MPEERRHNMNNSSCATDNIDIRDGEDFLQDLN